MKTALIFLVLAGVTQAQTPKAPWSDEQRAQYRAQRSAEIRRHNAAQEEAIRMVTQGIGALQRPMDPWNYNRYRGYNGYRPLYGNGYGAGGYSLGGSGSYTVPAPAVRYGYNGSRNSGYGSGSYTVPAPHGNGNYGRTGYHGNSGSYTVPHHAVVPRRR